MTIAGSLMILVSLFTNRWLIGGSSNNVANNIGFDNLGFGVDDRISVGIFLKCVKPEGDLIFEGECIPSLTELEKQFLSKDDNVYPHAWKGGIGCFVLGLAIMVFTVLLALLTPCCRTCLCCSVFTVSEVRRSAMLDTCLSVLRVCSNVR